MTPDFELLEQDVRADFRARWIGWCSTYQPGIGSSIGVPDTQIMVKPPMIESIEMKRGYVDKGRLFADKIRPAQVQWHTTLSMAGGKSWFYIGAMVNGEMVRYIVSSMIVLATRPQGVVLKTNAVSFVSIDPTKKRHDELFSSNIKTALG